MSADILVVDDEADIRELVAGILEDEGHRTRTAGSSDEALASIEARRPHLVFLDIWLQGSRLDGLQVLELVKAEHPDLPVVMISGHGNVETAVSAIKAGAYDFIEKPFKADRLVLVAERALEASASEARGAGPALAFRSGDAGSPASPSIINQLRQAVERAAPTNARILVTGAPGSGKELTARTIHGLSTRASGPFVVVSAATITPENMEAELFGLEGDGRQGAPRRRSRGGPWRHALHRRDRRHAARDAEPDPARSRGPELPARRRHDARSRGRAHHLLVEPRPAGRNRRRPLRRGPVPPPRRGADPRAVPVRAAGGRAGADRVLHGPDLRHHGPAEAPDRARMPWRYSSRTTGPETCASFATTSSG